MLIARSYMYRGCRCACACHGHAQAFSSTLIAMHCGVQCRVSAACAVETWSLSKHWCHFFKREVYQSIDVSIRGRNTALHFVWNRDDYQSSGKMSLSPLTASVDVTSFCEEHTNCFGDLMEKLSLARNSPDVLAKVMPTCFAFVGKICAVL